MKLSEAMREKMLPVLRAFPAEDRERNGEPSWNNRSSYEVQTRVHLLYIWCGGGNVRWLQEKYVR